MKEDNFEARIHDIKPKSIECKRCEELRKVIEAAKWFVGNTNKVDWPRIRFDPDDFEKLEKALKDLEGE